MEKLNGDFSIYHGPSNSEAGWVKPTPLAAFSE